MARTKTRRKPGLSGPDLGLRVNTTRDRVDTEVVSSPRPQTYASEGFAGFRVGGVGGWRGGPARGKATSCCSWRPGGGAARSGHSRHPGCPWSSEGSRAPLPPHAHQMFPYCVDLSLPYPPAQPCAPLPDFTPPLGWLQNPAARALQQVGRWGPACALGTSPQCQCPPTSPRGHPRLGGRHRRSANLPAGSGRGHRALRVCKLNLAFGRD